MALTLKDREQMLDKLIDKAKAMTGGPATIAEFIGQEIADIFASFPAGDEFAIKFRDRIPDIVAAAIHGNSDLEAQLAASPRPEDLGA